MAQRAPVSAPVLLRCRWRRVLSTMMTVVSATITGLCFYALIVAPPRDVREQLWLKLVLGFFLLLGSAAFVASVRTFLHPPVLFEATSDGIVMYRDGSGALARPFLVPWDRVETLEYLVERGVDEQGELAIVKTIAMQVHTDATWSPAGSLQNNFDAARQLVHLDAFTGTPHGRDLLRRLEAIRARHAPSAR